MKISFHAKRILVTGAGLGIGRGLVKKLVACDAEVVALSQDEKELASLKGEVPEISTIAVDVTDSEVTSLVEQYGPYHGLVNNAAISVPQPFLEVTPECFDRSFDVNVKAPILISQVVAKTMIDNKIQGSIVNVSSQASLIAIQDQTVYSGTKGALDIITKVMALELGSQYCIRVNCVNPTIVLTDRGKMICSDPERAEHMLDRIPLHRFAEVDDVVNAIIYLLSENSRMINGVILPVDGGATAN